MALAHETLTAEILLAILFISLLSAANGVRGISVIDDSTTSAKTADESPGEIR